jgi:hypothetical protein
VAVFGVPKIHEDDAVRAVYAAHDFLDAVSSPTSASREGHVELVFRTGIDAPSSPRGCAASTMS